MLLRCSAINISSTRRMCRGYFTRWWLVSSTSNRWRQLGQSTMALRTLFVLQHICLHARLMNMVMLRNGSRSPLQRTRICCNYAKQHHVHILNPQTGKREPLTACTRKDNPNLSKGDFLRTLWLIAKAVVLCQGLINRIDMALTGRKSKLGAFHGLMNQESQNATHPAMLVLHRCNSDVQFPYRFPVTAETHDDDLFGESCVSRVDPNVILQAAQNSQDA